MPSSPWAWACLRRGRSQLSLRAPVSGLTLIPEGPTPHPHPTWGLGPLSLEFEKRLFQTLFDVELKTFTWLHCFSVSVGAPSITSSQPNSWIRNGRSVESLPEDTLFDAKKIFTITCGGVLRLAGSVYKCGNTLKTRCNGNMQLFEVLEKREVLKEAPRGAVSMNRQLHSV